MNFLLIFPEYWFTVLLSVNFYKMGNNIPVVARLEFCMWRNMQLNLHLLDIKQMGDRQSFLNLSLQTVTSGRMLNQKETSNRCEVYFKHIQFINSQSIIIVILIPYISPLLK